MARNSEKAMTALARWRQMELGLIPEKRPYNPQDVSDLKKAEKFRRDLITDISRKIAQIQNPGLGEYKLRDLNDEINKLLREKYRWEDRIKQLGGPDFKKTGPRILDREGKEAPGVWGYKYFGAARDLPGVRELFEKPEAPPPKKSRGELAREADPFYYGFRDDEDQTLVPIEREAEQKALEKRLQDWLARHEDSAKQAEITKSSIGGDRAMKDIDVEFVLFKQEITKKEKAPSDSVTISKTARSSQEPSLTASTASLTSSTASSTLPQIAEIPTSGNDSNERRSFVAHVAVPSQKQVETLLLERKKAELLRQYCSDEQLASEAETRQILGAD